jgi:hypothetical protein
MAMLSADTCSSPGERDLARCFALGSAAPIGAAVAVACPGGRERERGYSHRFFELGRLDARRLPSLSVDQLLAGAPGRKTCRPGSLRFEISHRPSRGAAGRCYERVCGATCRCRRRIVQGPTRRLFWSGRSYWEGSWAGCRVGQGRGRATPSRCPAGRPERGDAEFPAGARPVAGSCASPMTPR